MKTISQGLALASLVFAFGYADSSERAVVCVKYATQSGWSEGYRVQATIASGYELNQSTKTYGYTSYAKYVVVFWDKGEASILELDLPFLSAVGQSAKDQRGRRWEVSEGGLCY